MVETSKHVNIDVNNDTVETYLSTLIDTQLKSIQVMQKISNEQVAISKTLTAMKQDQIQSTKNYESIITSIDNLTKSQNKTTESLDNVKQALTEVIESLDVHMDQYMETHKTQHADYTEELSKLDYRDTLEKMIESVEVMQKVFENHTQCVNTNIENVAKLSTKTEVMASRLKSLDTRINLLTQTNMSSLQTKVDNNFNDPFEEFDNVDKPKTIKQYGLDEKHKALQNALKGLKN